MTTTTATKPRTDVRAAVLAELATPPEDGLKIAELAKLVGAGESTVRKHVATLVTQGKVRRDGNAYYPDPTFAERTVADAKAAVQANARKATAGKPKATAKKPAVKKDGSPRKAPPAFKADRDEAQRRDAAVLKLVTKSPGISTDDVDAALAKQGFPTQPNDDTKHGSYISLYRLRKQGLITNDKRAWTAAK